MTASTPFDGEKDREAEEELDLADDERLPWLETGEQDEETAGIDASRLAMLGVLALVVLGLVVGGIWLVTNQVSDEPEPDGSVIAAPAEPYKTRPEDPGGKTFAGTGDTSFAVGEGRTRVGKLAEPTPVPATEPAAKTTGPSIASTVTESPAAASTSGVAVQVGAYPRRADAEAAWGRLIRQTEALGGVSHRVTEAQVDIGRVYRLQAMAGDRAAANRLCAALKSDGLACFVK